jgi:hypothetical protein
MKPSRSCFHCSRASYGTYSAYCLQGARLGIGRAPTSNAHVQYRPISRLYQEPSPAARHQLQRAVPVSVAHHNTTVWVRLMASLPVVGCVVWVGDVMLLQYDDVTQGMGLPTLIDSVIYRRVRLPPPNDIISFVRVVSFYSAYLVQSSVASS